MLDPTNNPDEFDALKAVTDATLAEVNTCLPGVIVRWDPARPHVADVQPVIQRVYLDDDGKEKALDQPVITDAPVAWPQGGGFVLTFPLKAGDAVELRFSQRSLDRWLASDGKTPHDCGDNRRFNLSDAVVHPGLSTQVFAAASADSVMLAAKDDSVHLKITPDGEVQIKAGKVRLGSDGAGEALAKAGPVAQRLGDLEAKVAAIAALLVASSGMPVAPGMTPFIPVPTDPASSKVYTDA